MTVKEKLLSEIELMQENEMINLFPFIEMIRNRVMIQEVYHGRPVVKEQELSKLDLHDFFNDGFNADEK